MVTDALLEYVRSQLTAGAAREAIRQALLSAGGWSDADIAEAFAIVAPPLTPAEIPPPPPPFLNPKQVMPPVSPPSLASGVPQSMQTPRVETTATASAGQSAPQQNYSFGAGLHPATNIYANSQNLATRLQYPSVPQPRRSHTGLIAIALILFIIFGAAGAAYAMPNIRAVVINKIADLAQKYGLIPAPLQPVVTVPSSNVNTNNLPVAPVPPTTTAAATAVSVTINQNSLTPAPGNAIIITGGAAGIKQLSVEIFPKSYSGKTGFWDVQGSPQKVAELQNILVEQGKWKMNVINLGNFPPDGYLPAGTYTLYVYDQDVITTTNNPPPLASGVLVVPATNYSASISSISHSATPTIKGTASGLSYLYIVIGHANPNSQTLSLISDINEKVPVANGHWSFTVTKPLMPN